MHFVTWQKFLPRKSNLFWSYYTIGTNNTTTRKNLFTNNVFKNLNVNIKY